MKRRPVRWMLAGAGVLAIGGFLALVLLRPRPPVASEGVSVPASSVAAMPARKCSCGGDCGRAAGALSHQPDLAPDSLASGAVRFAAEGRGADNALASDSYYRCPLHPDAASAGPGVCPVCRMPLSRMVAGPGPAGGCTCRSCPWARPGRVMAN